MKISNRWLTEAVGLGRGGGVLGCKGGRYYHGGLLAFPPDNLWQFGSEKVNRNNKYNSRQTTKKKKPAPWGDTPSQKKKLSSCLQKKNLKNIYKYICIYINIYLYINLYTLGWKVKKPPCSPKPKKGARSISLGGCFPFFFAYGF